MEVLLFQMIYFCISYRVVFLGIAPHGCRKIWFGVPAHCQESNAFCDSGSLAALHEP